MDKKSVHHSFVIVDIEHYGRRADTDQRWLRRQMYAVLRDAFTDAGIDWDACGKQDGGDSVILLVPADVSKLLLTDTFVARLDRELAGCARRSSEPVRMRMRLALHAGEVGRDEHGWVGTALNTACRLVDLQQARDELMKAPEVNLVLVVSDLWYTSVVEQDPVLAEQLAFTRIPFKAKEINTHAWLHLRRREGVGTDHKKASQPTTPAPPPSAEGGGFSIGHVGSMRDMVNGPSYHLHHGTDEAR
jgi:hypothetical protein